MHDIIIIRTGYKYRGENWDGIMPGYFEDVRSAVVYLEQQGYTLDQHDTYIKKSEHDVTRLARIDRLARIQPT